MSMDVFELVAQRAEPRPDYAALPVEWVDVKLQEYLWSVQRQIAESVRDNRYTAVPSCHDAGKSFIASRIVAWWIDSHPVGEAFAVTTAPTAAQVSAILWREVGKAHRKGKLIGQINRSPYSQWFIGPELVGYGRKPADYEQSAFQGTHAKYMLIVVDEACGIQRQLFDAVDALATNRYARVLAIGNPDDPGAHFASMCKPGSGWNVIQIDGLRTPNMTQAAIEGDGFEPHPYPLTAALMQAEGIPYATEAIPEEVRDGLVDPLWIEERLRRWCGFSATSHEAMTPQTLRKAVLRRAAQSSLFLAKVRGVFPTDASTGVIPLGWVEQAMARWRDWNDLGRPELPGRRVIGVDVAREGDDETVLAVRQGNCLQDLYAHARLDTTQTADEVALYLDWPQAMAIIDVIGIGAGVFDLLRRWIRAEKLQGTVVPFNASAKSERKDWIGQFKFLNDRAAAWWRMRELLDPTRDSKVMLPDDEHLKEELVAPKFKVLQGVIRVEPKEDIKKRLGRSTDRADAAIQSFWLDGAPIDLTTGEPVDWDGPGSGAAGGAIPYTSDNTAWDTADVGGWDL